MTAALALYTLGTRLAEPAAGFVLSQRLRRGKERADRIDERIGHASMTRPTGPLVWMHGASVGESRLLLDVFNGLRRRQPNLDALVTTQTLTSADMIAATGLPALRHQMAPVDAPNAIRRFLDHWRPDAAVFAEGEIWPNMLRGLKSRGVPAALLNARMTTRSLAAWRRQRASAREVFSAFGFIGAADQATAEGLSFILDRRIDVVGNLKQASTPERPSVERVATWRRDVGDRVVLLAASTHAGEDELALDAFKTVRQRLPDALLLIAPRHPERGDAVTTLTLARGWQVQQRSVTRAVPARAVDVLVADTMGELTFWYAAADAVYLGGAHAENVGGHNAVEPAQLGVGVFTGPHGYNFRETFAALAAAGALEVGTTASELAAYWLASARRSKSPFALEGFFEAARAPFEASLQAVEAMLSSSPEKASPHA